MKKYSDTLQHVLIVACLLGIGKTHAAGTLPLGEFEFKSAATKQCLIPDNTGINTQTGISFKLGTCNAKDNSTHLILEATTNPQAFKIKSVAKSLCLDAVQVGPANTHSLKPGVIWSNCSASNPSLHWIFYSRTTSSGTTFSTESVGLPKSCLSVDGQTSTQAILTSCQTSNSQQFFKAVSPSPESVTTPPPENPQQPYQPGPPPPESYYTNGGVNVGPTGTPGAPGTAGGTHKRLKIVNGCTKEALWAQWSGAPDTTFTAPNRQKVASGSFIEYDIPDKGLSSMRFWPGYRCDASGNNCKIGASGGPASLGFSCPPEGCSPPIDSKFEITFGCTPGVAEGACALNASTGTPLGRGDSWNVSFVDGYTVPIKVQVHGNCPTGPKGGIIDCSHITTAACPTNDNLSSDGKYPALGSVNLVAVNPATGEKVGCYSPSSKLTLNNWASGFQTYAGTSQEAQMYTCPTPPISSEQCRAGPAAKTKFTQLVHNTCGVYSYAYDDAFGLTGCDADTAVSYEVTFYCPSS